MNQLKSHPVISYNPLTLEPCRLLSSSISSDKVVVSTGGSLFLFNKRVLRFFRKDGHSWRKKKDGRTVGEAHERLKVTTFVRKYCVVDIATDFFWEKYGVFHMDSMNPQNIYFSYSSPVSLTIFHCMSSSYLFLPCPGWKC